ncbi:SDR family NAD(P)-dependent oxidoreductase, partial [Achromobacter ruhlandii]
MIESLQGKRVLVTAGAGGIGLAIARKFLASGAQVHICDVAAEAVQAAVQAHPGLSGSVTDVSDEAQVLAMFTDLAARWGRLDAPGNNAGVPGPTSRRAEQEPARWR